MNMSFADSVQPIAVDEIMKVCFYNKCVILLCEHKGSITWQTIHKSLSPSHVHT